MDFSPRYRLGTFNIFFKTPKIRIKVTIFPIDQVAVSSLGGGGGGRGGKMSLW